MDDDEFTRLQYKLTTREHKLTGLQHHKLSEVYHQNGRMIDFMYHRLMSYEKGMRCNDDIFSGVAIDVTHDVADYIFMITGMLTIHPEYSHFLRLLGCLKCHSGKSSRFAIVF